MATKSFAKALFLLFSSATAVCGLRAARLWYLSSLPAPEEFHHPTSSISDSIELHTLSILVAVQSTQSAVAAASVLNKGAAKWSAWTAGFGAAAALASLFM